MSVDQRNMHRYKISSERSEAVLRGPDCHFPVRLLDMSAGGFGAEVEHEIEVEAGQEYVLETIDAEYHICITHVRGDGDRKVLGLSRQEGHAVAEPETGKWTDLFASFFQRGDGLSSISLIGLGLIGALSLSISLSGSLPSLNSWTQLLATPHGPTRRSRESPSYSTTRGPGLKKSDITAMLRLKGKLTGQLRDQYIVLTSMLSPQVMDLHLTETQKSKIMQIRDSTTRQLTLLHESTSDTAPAASAALLQQAFEQAYSELTDEQRRQLIDSLQN